MNAFKYIMLVLGSIMSTSFYFSKKKVSIRLAEYDYSFTPQKKGCIDSLVEILDDSSELKIVLFDCKGKMHVEHFKNKNKMEEGDYVNSLGLLRKYITAVDGVNGTESIRGI